ncbi:class I SAM-dependent methyltransferase [Candidatus Falkowbacteria bacterium]|nr:class I SAM-dependent methyltransferase [Candidatus Falkowbacteria bacterium]
MKKIIDPKSDEQTRVGKATTDSVVINIHKAKHNFLIPFVFGKKILDAGCGAGWSIKLLEPYFQSAVGLDGNAKAIEIAHSLNIANTSFVLTDLHDFDLADKNFEAAISVDVIQQMVDPQRYLITIKKHLKENGALIVITPNIAKTKNTNPVHYREYDKITLVEELSRQFKVLNVLGLLKNDGSARLRFLWHFDPFKIRNYLPKTICSLTRKIFYIPGQNELSPDNYPITTELRDAYSFIAICVNNRPNLN